MINNKKILSAAMALVVAGSFAVAVPAFAETENSQGKNATAPGQMKMMERENGQDRPAGFVGGPGALGMKGSDMMERPTALGTVTAVNGSIITINSHQGLASTSPVIVLTVDATHATVVKNNATTTLSSVIVGDTIVVKGTLSGTTITATTIHDGAMRGPMAGGKNGRGDENGRGDMMSSSTMMGLGNGQPVVAGIVSAINGSSLTITTKSNVTYTIDATNAKVVQGQKTVTVSSVAVGDTVLVQGTINGTSVTASSIVDQPKSVAGTENSDQKNAPRGFFGNIGHFFMGIFGF